MLLDSYRRVSFCGRIKLAEAQRFTREWIDAWNSHGSKRILGHYNDDFERNSPVIVQIAGEPSGRLTGKPAVGAYWRAALGLITELYIELITVLPGIDSVVIHYRGAMGRLATAHADYA